jgi:hypothetical protein
LLVGIQLSAPSIPALAVDLPAEPGWTYGGEKQAMASCMWITASFFSADSN